MEFTKRARDAFMVEVEKNDMDAVKLEVVQTENGNALNVDLTKIEEGDRVIEQEGLKIVIDIDSEVMLSDVRFDADEEGKISMTTVAPSCSGSCSGCCGC